jgi:hypothetical protein
VLLLLVTNVRMTSYYQAELEGLIYIYNIYLFHYVRFNLDNVSSFLIEKDSISHIGHLFTLKKTYYK